MLSKLKKRTPDASEPTVLAWHPDFRNSQRLPDTKVVRTSFLLNGVAVLVAAVAVMALSYQLYQLRELNSEVDRWQLQIDRDKAPSAQGVALYKKFQAEASRVSAVDLFLKSRPVVSKLVLHLGESLPEYLAIDTFSMGATHLNLRGTVRGAPDQASGRASTYLQQLKSDSFITEQFSEVSLVNLNRDPKTGGLTLELSLKLKEAKKL